MSRTIPMTGDPPSKPLPPVEAEDAYLSDRWIRALHRHRFLPHEAARFLLETFPEACDAMQPYCSVRITQGHESGTKRVRFATGGWSGAETLIDEMLEHFWIRHYHTEWKTGGLFIFVVPNWAVRP